MTIKSPVLTTTTSLTAMAHPFVDTFSTDFERGVPIGINTRTNKVEYFNPWAMKEAGTLENMLGLFLGLIQHGKSMAMKIIAIRLMMLTAGYQSMHTVINDYKPEGKESEYGAFSRVTGSNVFHIAKMQVNPLEERLFASKGEKAYELGILGMAKSIVEFGKNASLVGHEDTCLRIAVYTMLKYDSRVWGLGLLAKLLRSISIEQIKGYYVYLDDKLKNQLENRILSLSELTATSASTKLGVVDQISQLVNAKDNTDLFDIQSAGDRVSAYLDSVLQGSFGKMLGDSHSLYEMSTQRTVTKSWLGVDAEAETLMRIIDTSFKTSAIENHQLDLLPHLDIDDERHRSMSNIIYARSSSFFGEISRGIHTCSLSASHRLNSLRKGGEGSELFNLGNTTINNLGFVGIGKQNNNEKDLKELQDRYGFSNAERDGLASLPKHVFAMKYAQAEPVRYVQFVATPMEIAIGKTEAAVERMMQHPDLENESDIERYARENNLELASSKLEVA